MLPIMISGKEILSSQNQALYTLLKPMRKKESEAFRSFLTSEYFNDDKRLIPLFDRLISAYQGSGSRMNGLSLIKGVLNSRDEETGISELRQLMKKLEKLTLEFFAHQELRQPDSHLRYRALVGSLKRRRDIQRFREASQTFRRTLDKAPGSIMTYADRWWLEHENYFYQHSLTYGEDGRYFEWAFQHFNDFSRAVILRFYLEYVNRSNLFQDKLQMKQIEDWYQFFRQTPPANPLEVVYEHLIQALRDRDDLNAYQAFKSVYQQHRKALVPIDKLIVLKIGQNISNYLFLSGYPSAAAEMFFWAKEGIETKTFLLDGTISDAVYLNVALSAAAAGEFEYQHYFMHHYRRYLEKAYQDKAFFLAMAYYHFHQEQYEETIELLETHFPKYNNEEYVYTLRAKTLLVRIYLLRFLKSWDNSDEYEKEIDALRKFISRKGFLKKAWTDSYFNFIKICNKLFSHRKHSLDKSNAILELERAELLEELNGFEQVACRQWLKELLLRTNEIMS